MSAPWLVAMDWRDALFVHWPVAAAPLRALIPRALELDVLDGSAWIGIVAFRITRARLRGVPARLGIPAFGEVNVRTYVTGGGTPGVWFLSLDAANALAARVGRRALHLPYHDARVAAACNGDGSCAYRSERADTRSAPARFEAAARVASNVRFAAPGSIEHRLVERYCFFTVDRRGRTLRGDVRHPPWPLRDATVTITANSLLAAAGVEVGADTPLVHASAGVATHARPLVRVTR